jgi:hypothetical protein
MICVPLMVVAAPGRWSRPRDRPPGTGAVRRAVCRAEPRVYEVRRGQLDRVPSDGRRDRRAAVWLGACSAAQRRETRKPASDATNTPTPSRAHKLLAHPARPGPWLTPEGSGRLVCAREQRVRVSLCPPERAAAASVTRSRLRARGPRNGGRQWCPPQAREPGERRAE